jgi:integral membrane protein (TIGR01906 family)
MRRLAGIAETVVVAVLWAAVAVGLAAIALTIPVYTTMTSQWLGVPATAGLSTAETLQLSGNVRGLVSDPEYDALPSEYHGQPAFDASAVSHLMDVRAVLGGAKAATGAAAALLAVWVGWCVGRQRWTAMRSGMVAGGWLTLIAVTLAAAAALIDFETFFAGFHGLFFKAGTWTFPADSMLIRLFPERFWATAGLAWGTLAALIAAALLVGVRQVPGARKQESDRRRVQEV